MKKLTISFLPPNLKKQLSDPQSQKNHLLTHGQEIMQGSHFSELALFLTTHLLSLNPAPAEGL